MGTDLDICRNRHGGADTSVEAFKGTPKSMRRNQAERILDRIVTHGPCTCESVELALRLRHQTCSARVSELLRDRLIEDTGTRGRTLSGATARLYVPTQRGRANVSHGGINSRKVGKDEGRPER